jgi:hypothetical protein
VCLSVELILVSIKRNLISSFPFFIGIISFFSNLHFYLFQERQRIKKYNNNKSINSKSKHK